MKTPIIKSLLLAAFVAALGLTAHAQYPGIFPATNAFTAPTAAELQYRQDQLGSGGLLFGESLYLNSTLGVTNIFTGWGSGPVPTTGFNPAGGQVKVIYIGKTAGWENDFGYVTVPPGSIGGYHPLATNINGTTPISGYEKILTYGAGETLDFFVNSGGPLGHGGLFYAFGQANEYAGMDNSIHVHYTSAMLGSLLTYFIGYEDTRQIGMNFQDQDFNDLMVAIQFLPSVAVPEPATYGMIGALGLLALIGFRRFKTKAKAAA